MTFLNVSSLLRGRASLSTAALFLLGLSSLVHAANPTSNVSSLSYTIDAGGSLTKSVLITNTDPRPRKIFVGLSGSNRFSHTSTSCGSAVNGGGGTCRVYVRYASSTAGTHTGTLTLGFAPYTPNGLSATDGTSTSVSISWNAVTDVTNYQLRWRPAGGSWNTVNRGTSRSWSHTPSSGNYEYQVRAGNAQGYSDWTAIETGYPQRSCPNQTKTWNGCTAATGVKAPGTHTLNDSTKPYTGVASISCNGVTGAWSGLSATSCTAPPANPGSISASDGTFSGKIRLTWSAASGATSYQYRYRKDGTTTWTTKTGTSGVDTAVPDSSFYEFQVRALNAGGESAWQPATPETGYAARVCPGQTFTWGNCSGTLSNKGAGTYTVIDDEFNYTGSATVSCDGVTGAWSGLSATSCAAPPAAPASGGISATDGTIDGEIELTWGTVANADGYRYRYRKSGATTWTTSNGTSPVRITVADTADYEFQVQAYGAGGNSAWEPAAMEIGFAMRHCPENTFTWGDGNSCSATLARSPFGIYNLTDDAFPHTGTATVSCNRVTGGWEGLTSDGCVLQPEEVHSVTASKGVYLSEIELTWDPLPGADSYEYRYALQDSLPSGPWSLPVTASTGLMHSTTNKGKYLFQVRAINAGGYGPWTPGEGPGSLTDATGWIQQSCVMGEPTWGHEDACSSWLPYAEPTENLVRSITSMAQGTEGEAVATCNVVSGEWELSDTWCSIGLDPEFGSWITATDGEDALDYQIRVDWSPVPTMQYYTLQSRRRDAGENWDSITTAQTETSFTWDVSDDVKYEFRVCAQAEMAHRPYCSDEPIAVGAAWPHIKPVFINQNIPAYRVGAGETFQITQKWRNEGSTTWTEDSAGFVNNQPVDRWSLGKVPIVGEMAKFDTQELTIDLTAPEVPGEYTFATIFDKLGVTYPDPSADLTFLVLKEPECGTLTTNITQTWNSHEEIDVVIGDVTSAEEAWIAVYSEAEGQENATIYPAVAQDEERTTWNAGFDLRWHADFGPVYIEAWAKNGINNHEMCKTTTLQYLELPDPVVELAPIVGSYTAGTDGDPADPLREGFVIERNTGNFASMTVTLPGFEELEVKYELINPGGYVMHAKENIETNDPTLIRTNSTSGLTWQEMPVKHLLVTYQDTDAARQGKQTVIPLALALGPQDMDVALEATSDHPLDLLATIKNSGSYLAEMHGPWSARLLEVGDGNDAAELLEVDLNGEARYPDMNYLSLYNKQLRSEMTAIPPEHITLLTPITFVSDPIDMPMLPPSMIDATDGTRVNDVLVTWEPPMRGMSVTYQVFRDGIDVSGELGPATRSFVDQPPERGRIYTYGLKSSLSEEVISGLVTDEGHVPLCREMILANGGLNADMSAVTGIFEVWGCLSSAEITYGFDSEPMTNPLVLTGDGIYKTFAVAIPPDMEDGVHMIRFEARSVHQLDGEPTPSPDETSTHTIAFVLAREEIAVNNLNILYNRVPAPPSGTVADSIGRFGISLDGGGAIAPPVPE